MIILSFPWSLIMLKFVSSHLYLQPLISMHTVEDQYVAWQDLFMSWQYVLPAGPAQAVGPVGLWPYHFFGRRVKKSSPALSDLIREASYTCSESSFIMASCSRFTNPLPELPCSPHQPSDFTFPKRSFGKTAIVWRSFQPSWFKQWPFLHYDEANDVAYCHTCATGFKQGKMRASNADPAFVSVCK